MQLNDILEHIPDLKLDFNIHKKIYILILFNIMHLNFKTLITNCKLQIINFSNSYFEFFIFRAINVLCNFYVRH